MPQTGTEGKWMEFGLSPEDLEILEREGGMNRGEGHQSYFRNLKNQRTRSLQRVTKDQVRTVREQLKTTKDDGSWQQMYRVIVRYADQND